MFLLFLMNNCERKDECGFVDWLKTKGDGSDECGKDPRLCPRPIGFIPIETVGPATEEEWDRALPARYVSGDGRKRRLP